VEGGVSVYFIRAGVGGPVKIGWAVDAMTRLRDLQCGNHEELTLIHCATGGVMEEKSAHRQFMPHRIRGEWFSFDPKMVGWEPPTDHPVIFPKKVATSAAPPDDSSALIIVRAVNRVRRAIQATSKAEVSRRSGVAESNLREAGEPTWRPNTATLEKLERAAQEIERERAKEAWASGAIPETQDAA
jgi:Meiotically up-regulated gene 113